MRAFSEYNPIVLFVYFISAAGIAMFCMHPVITALSLSGALSLYIIRNGRRGIGAHFFFLAMFIIMSLISPAFTHNGVTVLFVVNDNPITLEALLYGIVASATAISVIYWFRSFSQLMTSDRLLYLFGFASPKLALILSMALRYIPLFGAQIKKVNLTQKALGLYSKANAPDSIRGGMRVFSVMVTWALENGIITADSMSARGYGTGKRTFFSLYLFRKSDIILLAVVIFLFAAAAAGVMSGALGFSFYPRASFGKTAAGQASPLFLASYAALSFLPSVLEILENIKWNYLKSKI